MKKWLLVALLSLVLLAAGYIALPRYTIEQLEQAAQSESTEQLQCHIDFPALRDKLMLRLQRKLRDSMGEKMPPELGELFVAGTNLFMAPLLRQLVMPKGVAGLLRGGRDLHALERELYRQVPPPGGGLEAAPEAGDHAPDSWQLQGWGLVGIDRASADYGDGGRHELRLILERQGLRWRLVDIALLTETPQN